VIESRIPPDGARWPGRFVVLEGGDGAGKTTQLERLAEALRQRGLGPVVVTREPGGTPLGAQIRSWLLDGGAIDARAEALLYAADRAQHVAAVIGPGLARGAIVLSDRHVDSTIAYQGDGRGLPMAEIVAVNRIATGGVKPDLTVLLAVPPEVGAARRDGPADRIEAEQTAFHARVRERYLALAAASPERYLVVDATGPPAEVHRLVLAGTLAALDRPEGVGP
jgi:dTMP kinase